MRFDKNRNGHARRESPARCDKSRPREMALSRSGRLLSCNVEKRKKCFV
jgi:hypothetical protein